MNSGKIATTLEDDHLSDAGGYDATALRVDAGASAVINGGTIENICDFTSAIENYGTVVVNDATITAIHTAVYNGGAMTFNGGSVSCGMNGTTRHTIYNVSGKTAINGGTFINTATDQNATGASVINGNVEVNGGTFSGRIENYYGTPVIKGGTFSVNPNAKFLATGYKAIANADGTYTVIFPQESFDSLIDNAQAGETVNVPAGEYTFPASDLKEGMILNCAPGTVFEGNSNLNINGATVVGATFSNPTGTAADQTINGTFKNCVFEGKNALRWCYAGETVVFENCVFNASSVYAIHFDGTTGKDITFKNCDITGWVAIAGGQKSLTFDGCTINGNGTYGVIRVYGDATIKDCTFDVDNVNTTDVYQDGIHAVGCTVDVINCKNANGDIKDLFNISDQGTINLFVDGIQYVDKPITNVTPAPDKNDMFPAGTNVLSFSNMDMKGDAKIVVDQNYSVAINNVSADVNGSVIIMDEHNPAVFVQNSEFVLDDGEYLIDASAFDGGVYQIFLVNVKVNGEYLTRDTAAKYLNNVNWYDVVNE